MTMSDQTPSCIVIGAGIVGSSCAWHLQDQGVHVTLIDPELPGQSTSSGNAGCISTSSIIPFSYPGAIWQVPGWLFDPLGPFSIRWSHLMQLMPWMWKFWRAGNMAKVEEIAAAQFNLMSTVVDDYDRILTECGSRHLKKERGLIRLYDRPEDLHEKPWELNLRQHYGLEWHRIGKDELKVMEPAVVLGDGVALVDPAWHHLTDPAAATASIADNAISSGTRWIHDRVETIIDDDEGVTVITGKGDHLKADKLVVAAGAWSGQLVSQLGFAPPMTAKRGYHSMVVNPNVELNHPLMGVTAFFVITPMLDGIRVAGTAEFASNDASPDYRRARAMMHHAHQFLPDLAGAEIKEWMGRRPMMPDSLPVIGLLPNHPRIIAAFGHGHYGITQGPTTGRIVADLVHGRKPHIDLAPFALERF